MVPILHKYSKFAGAGEKAQLRQADAADAADAAPADTAPAPAQDAQGDAPF